MTRLLAVDPGNELSAWLVYDTAGAGAVVGWAKVPNADLLAVLPEVTADLLAVEMIASYGMPVGREIFDTCVWIGRYIERWGGDYRLVYRKEVKRHLCGTDRARDPNVRQALLDRFGPGKELAVGTKRAPGPLYGVAGDGWAALGVAVTVADTPVARAPL